MYVSDGMTLLTFSCVLSELSRRTSDGVTEPALAAFVSFIIVSERNDVELWVGAEGLTSIFKYVSYVVWSRRLVICLYSVVI